MTNNYKAKNSILLFLPATNFNEQEYIIINNALGKAGYKTFVVSDSSFLCIGSNGLKVKNDILLYNVHENNFAGFIIIGGKGTRNYWDNKNLHLISTKFVKNKKAVGAICSAPIILAKAGLITEAATCYPEDIKALESEGVIFKECKVVSSNKIVTGQDPASSDEFINAFLSQLTKN